MERPLGEAFYSCSRSGQGTHETDSRSDPHVFFSLLPDALAPGAIQLWQQRVKQQCCRREASSAQSSCGSKKQTPIAFFLYQPCSMAPQLGVDMDLPSRGEYWRLREPNSTREIVGSEDLRSMNANLHKCRSNPKQHIKDLCN